MPIQNKRGKKEKKEKGETAPAHPLPCKYSFFLEHYKLTHISLIVCRHPIRAKAAHERKLVSWALSVRLVRIYIYIHTHMVFWFPAGGFRSVPLVGFSTFP